MLSEKAQEAQGWFRKAAQDLRVAELVLSAKPPIVDDGLFHAQQAAEKAIKGFLVWHESPFRKTHDLREIGGLAIGIDPSLEPILRRAARLSPFAGYFATQETWGSQVLRRQRRPLLLPKRSSLLSSDAFQRR